MPKLRLKISALTTLMAFLLVGCSTLRPNAMDDQVPAARKNQTIAVLPVEIYFSDNAPAWLLDRRDQESLVSESLAYQQHLYEAFHERTAERYPDFDLQPVATTLERLRSFNLDPAAIGGVPTHTLADILGVDAVIRTEIEKQGPHEAPFDIANLIEYGDNAVEETGIYEARCVLVDGLTGAEIWQIAMRREVERTALAQQVIVAVARDLVQSLFGADNVLA